ncbi:MAG TPA: hypothetical protein VGW38_15960 [Chloroflexota bacterium]|nr:hypothetical protein [Chloroflexota bacterium]
MAGRGRQNADLTLIVAIAAGATQEQAAKQAGVSPRTVARRLADPEFQRQVDETRAATLRQATDRLSAASLAAVATLLKLLNADSESARLGAARAILELGAKLRESQDLEQRIAALEQRIGQQGESRRWAS